MRRLARKGIVQLLSWRSSLCAELVAPIGFAETILHGPALLASVPAPDPAGPIVSSSDTLAAIIRTGWRAVPWAIAWTVARAWTVAGAISWRRAVAGIGTEIEIDLLRRGRAGDADDRPCRHRRYQDVLHGSPSLVMTTEKARRERPGMFRVPRQDAAVVRMVNDARVKTRRTLRERR
jgi:hypothetical protein